MIPAGVYLRTTTGLRDMNTGAHFTAGDPVVAPDSFQLGVTKPSPANTGVRDPSLLQVHNGSITTSRDGQVIENLDIWGRVVVQHADVTIRNSIVRGTSTHVGPDQCISALHANVRRLLIDRVLVSPQAPSQWTNGIDGHDFTARRVHVRDVVDYFGLWNSGATRVNNTYPLNVRLEAPYGERMAYFSPASSQPTDDQTHNDGIQFQGGQGAVVIGHLIRAVYGPAGSHQPGVSGATPSGWPNPSLACLMFNNNVGATGLHTITDGWFEGGFLPVNTGGAPGVDLGVMHRNRFDGLSGLNQTPRATITRRADQQLDAGVGTADQNTFYDGTPVLVRTNA